MVSLFAGLFWTCGDNIMIKALLFLIVIIVGVYLFLYPETVTDIIDSNGVEISIGGSRTWTNENFTTVAKNPTDYAGDRARLNGFLFNRLNISGRSDIVGLEIFLGSSNDLMKNPTDTNRRILVGVPRDLGEELSLEACVHVDGVIRGEARVTTMDGTVISPVFIEGTSVTRTNCTQ